MELTRPHRVAYVDGVRMGIIATGIAGRYTGPTRRRFWLCDLNARKVLHGPYDRLSKAHKALDGLLMGTGDSGNVPGRLLARLLLG